MRQMIGSVALALALMPAAVTAQSTVTWHPSHAIKLAIERVIRNDGYPRSTSVHVTLENVSGTSVGNFIIDCRTVDKDGFTLERSRDGLFLDHLQPGEKVRHIVTVDYASTAEVICNIK